MAIRKGLVFVWSGAIVDIPTGWHLCDGSLYDGEYLPDLRDQFIVGAGDNYSPEDSGGSINHTHNFTSDTHRHGLPPGSGIQAGVYLSGNTTYDSISGSTVQSDARPLYFALAFIIKL